MGSKGRYVYPLLTTEGRGKLSPLLTAVEAEVPDLVQLCSCGLHKFGHVLFL